MTEFPRIGLVLLTHFPWTSTTATVDEAVLSGGPPPQTVDLEHGTRAVTSLRRLYHRLPQHYLVPLVLFLFFLRHSVANGGSSVSPAAQPSPPPAAAATAPPNGQGQQFQGAVDRPKAASPPAANSQAAGQAAQQAHRGASPHTHRQAPRPQQQQYPSQVRRGVGWMHASHGR